MITNNPFSTLAEIVPAIAMQGFVIAMAALTLIGVLVDIVHKKNVRYFFDSPVYVRQTPLTLTLAPLTNFVLNLLGDLMHRFQ